MNITTYWSEFSNIKKYHIYLNIIKTNKNFWIFWKWYKITSINEIILMLWNNPGVRKSVNCEIKCNTDGTDTSHPFAERTYSLVYSHDKIRFRIPQVFFSTSVLLKRVRSCVIIDLKRKQSKCLLLRIPSL